MGQVQRVSSDSRKPTVLVIDDEEQMRELLREAFAESYEVLVAPNGHAGLKMARESRPDAIILDLLMPEFDGISVCEGLQSVDTTRDIPVIMLTAAKNIQERLRAFKAGADDFVGKPFLLEELQVRLDSKLKKRRAPLAIAPRAAGPEPLLCGNLLLDPDRFLIEVAGKEVKLSVLEFNLVRFFVENVGRLLPRDEIIASVWKEKAIMPRALDWHILTLRRKLEGFDHRISTVYGAGYILKAGA